MRRSEGLRRPVQEDDPDRIPGVFGFMERRNCLIREVFGAE